MKNTQRKRKNKKNKNL